MLTDFDTVLLTPTVQDEMLGLPQNEMLERYYGRVNEYIYRGQCTDEIGAVQDPPLIGQSWIPDVTCDYKPSVHVRNKIKPLLNKQKRFMFGSSPDLLLKPLSNKDKKATEELRQFIDKVLTKNDFWHDTMKAFLSASIKKRVLLRVEANINQPITICYEPIENFHFECSKSSSKILEKVVMISQDLSTIDCTDLDDQIWYRYIYTMNPETKTCWLETDTFIGISDIEKYTFTKVDTKLSKLPTWVIINAGVLGDIIGESDVNDLKGPQDAYNHRVSDFNDALRFQMFGETYIIDATEQSVNKAHIAPNALVPLVSVSDTQKASVQKAQSSFSSAVPVEAFLKGIDNDMHEIMSMPLPEDLKGLPSAKAMRYAYADLIARCEEKWHDWEPSIIELIQFIIESCTTLDCYKEEWKTEWESLDYTIILKHNYPLPEDMSDDKDTAMKEVAGKTRSIHSYIKDFSDEEDVEGEYIQILDEQFQMASAVQDQYTMGANGDLITDPNNNVVDTPIPSKNTTIPVE